LTGFAKLSLKIPKYLGLDLGVRKKIETWSAPLPTFSPFHSLRQLQAPSQITFYLEHCEIFGTRLQSGRIKIITPQALFALSIAEEKQLDSAVNT
jgi:hypothetical protein